MSGTPHSLPSVRAGLAALLAVALAACATTRPRPPPLPGPVPVPAPPGDIAGIPDAVPRAEPRSA
ncbi:MAG TPA: hypothetical protein VGH61_04805, partial [Steroidobacteraceae bacterium]